MKAPAENSAPFVSPARRGKASLYCASSTSEASTASPTRELESRAKRLRRCWLRVALPGAQKIIPIVVEADDSRSALEIAERIGRRFWGWRLLEAGAR